MVRAAVLAVAALAACARGDATQGNPDSSVNRIDALATDANSCAVQPCSILPQCGCVGNSACDRAFGGGTACRPINANGTETAACTSSNQCDEGYTCVGNNGQNRTCKKYCTIDGECGTPRGKCFYEFVGTDDMPLPNIPKACTSNCQPEDATAALCPSTMKCTLLLFNDNGTTTLASECTPAGTGTQGTSCSLNNAANEAACSKGFTCALFTNESTHRCRRVCTQPGMASAQCGGQQCIGYSTPQTFAGVTYGVCAP